MFCVSNVGPNVAPCHSLMLCRITFVVSGNSFMLCRTTFIAEVGQHRCTVTNSPMSNRYITTFEAQVRSGLSGSSISRLAKAGKITQWVDPADRRRRLYDAAEIDRLITVMGVPEPVGDRSTHPSQRGLSEAATGA